MDMEQVGRLLIIIGCLIVAVGMLLIFINRFMPSLGQLPGDLHVAWGNVSCFFPLATSIILSIILTIVLNIVARLFK